MDVNYTEARYVRPPVTYFSEKRKSFQKILGGFATYMKMNTTDFRANIGSVDEISSRLHQRLNYYLFFHGRTLEQSRQAAVKAYWILRYRPLKAVVWDKDYDVNIYFAFFVLFVEAMGQTFKDCPKTIQVVIVDSIRKDYEKDFLRAFSEYDISKEAMMLVSDGCVNKFVLMPAQTRCDLTLSGKKTLS